MYLAHLHTRSAPAGPEFVFVSVLGSLLVHLFQLIAIPAVPDAVPDGISLEVQDLVNLDAVPAGRHHIQPGTNATLNCLIHVVQPPHFFSASSNPIRFRYGIHAY